MLPIGAVLFYYKLGQTLLQIGTIFVTNWGSYYKLGQHFYKTGQSLQIGAKFITNRSRYYKSGQLLQIGA